MSSNNDKQNQIINNLLHFNRTIDKISCIGATILFSVLSYLNWTELLEKKPWPTTYYDFVECIIVPMMALTFFIGFILEIREERAYKKAIKNNQPFPVNNKFYKISLCFIIGYALLFLMIIRYTDGNEIFYFFINITVILTYWFVSILHYFRINIHNFLKHKEWNKIDRVLYKNTFEDNTNDNKTEITIAQTTTKVYHNYIFPRVTLLLVAVLMGLFGYIAWNEYHYIYGTPDDEVYIEIIFRPLLSISALVATIFFNRIKISKKKTLRDLYDEPNGHKSCFAIFTLMLVCILLQISDAYTMRTKAFQSVEYLYLTIAFWIWGALSCFSTNIHQYLTRKGWNKIDKLLYRNMFKEEEKSNLK